jgi:hypothetical protein
MTCDCEHAAPAFPPGMSTSLQGVSHCLSIHMFEQLDWIFMTTSIYSVNKQWKHILKIQIYLSLLQITSFMLFVKKKLKGFVIFNL